MHAGHRYVASFIIRKVVSDYLPARGLVLGGTIVVAACRHTVAAAHAVHGIDEKTVLGNGLPICLSFPTNIIAECEHLPETTSRCGHG